MKRALSILCVLAVAGFISADPIHWHYEEVYKPALSELPYFQHAMDNGMNLFFLVTNGDESYGTIVPIMDPLGGSDVPQTGTSMPGDLVSQLTTFNAENFAMWLTGGGAYRNFEGWDNMYLTTPTVLLSNTYFTEGENVYVYIFGFYMEGGVIAFFDIAPGLGTLVTDDMHFLIVDREWLIFEGEDPRARMRLFSPDGNIPAGWAKGNGTLPVPEPATGLLALAGIGLLIAQRRKRA